jgi:hypothetical protein
MIDVKRVTRASLGALVLGLGVAPSCTALPASETMVILQTDLSLPKDVDKLTIEVLVRGDRRHVNSFEKLGDQASLQIPASLGITLDEGTDLSTPFTFRVTAYQGTTARVLREVVTTIPKDRLVALRMPIQWLCWDQVTMDAEGNAASSCPNANETCIAGTCVDKTVDPTTLADFAASDVFGGGTGANNDGTCFDTATCFTGSVDAAVNLGDCTIATTGDVNVAIRVDSAGICGAAGCFVPLDAKSDFGWKPGANGTIQLPPAVCKRIAAGSASGVSTVSASSACPLKTEGIPACGPWSSAGKVPTDPSELAPVTIIANQLKPVSLAVGGDHVYWTLSGAPDAADGAVKSIAVTGGSTTLIQGKQAFTRDIALNLDPTSGKVTNVLWASAGVGMMGATVIDRDFSVPTKVHDLALKLDPSLMAPDGVAASGKGLVFTDFGANAVYYADESTTTTLASTKNGTPANKPYRIAADATAAFWTNEGTPGLHDGSITRCTVADPLPTEVVTGQDFPRNLVLDRDPTTLAATAVYWANYGTSGDPTSEQVMMVSLSDLTKKTSIAAGHKPYGLALDKDNVYWTNQGDNTVMKAPKAGGAAHKVATGQNKPGAIAVDATHIYWINEGAEAPNLGSIMRISKAAPEAK